MITQGTRHFVKGTDTRVAAFREGTVDARTINARVAGNRQHTPRPCRNPSAWAIEVQREVRYVLLRNPQRRAE